MSSSTKVHTWCLWVVDGGGSGYRGPLCYPRSLVLCSELLSTAVLEEPAETILLSLVGVGSIVASQWPTVLQDNDAGPSPVGK